MCVCCEADDNAFTYRMTLRTKDMKNLRRLAQSLMDMDDVYEFSITPTS